MSFRFNFSDDSGDERDSYFKENKIEEDHKSQQKVLPFVEVIPDFKLKDDVKISSYHFKNKSTIKCVWESKDSSNKNHSTTNLNNEVSDLIPRVYEGGLKVWECSLDLVEYFIEQNVDFKSKTVLELGCGCGIPGLYALMNFAESVHFQDYNEEVLTQMTAPNVSLNISTDIKHESCHKSRVRFFAGDWSYLLDQDLKKYDVILSSETIYCPDNYAKLHNIFEKFLHPKGICLIAAKTFYFGVGGGIQDFEKFVKGKAVFDIISTKTFTEGVQREILSLKFKK